ncbi:MAG: hypothetical protein WCK39_06530 [Methanomassiliicoccales archaeon]
MLSTKTLAIAATLSVLALLIFSDFAPVPTELSSADGSRRQEVEGTVISVRSAGAGLLVVLEDASGSATIYCKTEGVSTEISVGSLAIAVITGSGDDGLLFAATIRPL